MKKWICTIIFLLGFTNLSAFANYQVFFGNTGRPATFSHGPCHRHSINNFGSNAAFAPHNTRGRRFVRDSFARPVSGRYSRPRPDYIYEHNHDYIMARTRNRRARMQRRYSRALRQLPKHLFPDLTKIIKFQHQHGKEHYLRRCNLLWFNKCM